MKTVKLRPGRRLARGAALLGLAALSACAPRPAVTVPPPAAPPSVEEAAPSKLLDFEATAYTTEGETKSGKRTRDGIVAADPAVLPLGSRIRIHDAGSYSGVYEVADTGRTIRGREVDIYIENGAEARRFGRRRVRVEILERSSD